MHALLVWLGASVALAHPFDGRLYGHRLDVSVDGDHLRLEYDAEVPTVDAIADLRSFAGPRPLDAAVEAEWRSRTVAALGAGLRVRTDQGDVALAVSDRGSAAGDTRTVAFRLALVGALPEGARSVGLVNHNHLERPAVFSTRLHVDDGLRLDACTLFRVQDGRILRDSSGDWISEEAARDLRFAFRRWPAPVRAARALWRRLVEPAPEAPLREARAALTGVRQDPLALLARSAPDAEGRLALALGGAAGGLLAGAWGFGAVDRARRCARGLRVLALAVGLIVGWVGLAFGAPRWGVPALAALAWAGAGRWAPLGPAGGALLAVAALRTVGGEALPRGDWAVLASATGGALLPLLLVWVLPAQRPEVGLARRVAAAGLAVLGVFLSELLDSGMGVQ